MVDNGGSPRPSGWPAPGVRVIQNETNAGYAAACNQGAALAVSPLLLFLNDDALLAPRALDALLSEADRQPAGAVWQPLCRRPDGSVESVGELFTWAGFFAPAAHPPGAQTREVFSTRGIALLVRRTTFVSLNGFRSDYFAYFEESDLCWRARVAGHQVFVVPGAEVHHEGSYTSRRLFEPHQIRYLSFRNRIWSILANAGAWSLVRIVPLHLLGCLGVGLALLLRGQWMSALSVVRALAWPLANSDQVLAHRRSAQRGRKEPDRSVLRRGLRAGVTGGGVRGRLKDHLAYWARS